MYSIRRVAPRTSRPHHAPVFRLQATGSPARRCSGGSELLHELEQHLVVALQRARPELLFLHAAALAFRGRACLLVGASGAGKSTTAWALLQRGWGYLSDELAPLDPTSGLVLPYPHALCLKQAPPGAMGWPPPGLLDLGATLHVPPRTAAATACPLGAIVFVEHDRPPSQPAPSIRAVSVAEASARLYAQSLNLLAHPERGLDVVRHTAQRVPCWHLQASDLHASAALLEDTLQAVLPAPTAHGSPGGNPGPRRTAGSRSPDPSSA